MYCVELRTELEANKSSEIIPELFIDSAGNRTQSVRILSTHAESCHVGVIPCDRVVNAFANWQDRDDADDNVWSERRDI